MEITKTNGVIYFTDGDKSTMIPQEILQTAVIEKSGGGINIIYNKGGKDTELNILYANVTNPVVTSSDTLISELYTLIGQPLTATVVYDTPVNAVAAQGTLTLTAGTGNTILTNKTVTVGGKVYTFKTALTPTEGQVLIGANDTAALLNLLNAINHEGTPNTDYKCAAANANVVGISSDATTLIVENKVKGVIGNTSAVATDIAGAWDAETLGTTVEGVDGTYGEANTIYHDADYLYMTIGNTIHNANWKKIAKATL